MSSVTTTVQMPSPARVHTPTNNLDNFFGTSSTHESRHDSRRSMTHAEDLPSYYEDVSAPEYEEVDTSEPITLAMYLFKFGFVFPLFWVLGAFILFSPLRAPPATPSEDGLPSVWLPEKTEAEREAIIARVRDTEVKWAKRCLWASCILAVVAVTVGLTVWGVTRR